MNMPMLVRTDIHLDGTLDELHEQASAFVEASFINDGFLRAHYLVDDGAHWLWIETPFETNDEKYMTTVTIRQVLLNTDALIYAQIGEAVVDGHDLAFVVTIDRSGAFLCARWPVTIRPATETNILGNRQDVNGDPALIELAGQMFDLFGKERAVAGA